MKNVNIFSTLFLIFFLQFRAFAQNSHQAKQELVMSFLNYIKEPGWKFDTLSKKYLLFRTEESTRFSRNQRKMMISFAVSYLSTEIQNINFNELTIKPYLETDSMMKTLFIKPDTRKKVYVVYTNDRQFRRYFLIDSNRISSFITIKKDRSFVLLN